jgi:hypothetical protein
MFHVCQEGLLEHGSKVQTVPTATGQLSWGRGPFSRVADEVTINVNVISLNAGVGTQIVHCTHVIGILPSPPPPTTTHTHTQPHIKLYQLLSPAEQNCAWSCSPLNQMHCETKAVYVDNILYVCCLAVARENASGMNTTMLIWKYKQSPISTVEVIICVILLNIAHSNTHELFFPTCEL